MQKKTRQLALGGLMAALGTVLLCLGGIVPFALYACPILASLTLLILREECPPLYGWCCYGAVSVLGLLLGPDKEAAALFIFLGYYPLLKPKLDSIYPKVFGWLIKFVLAAVSVVTMYALLLYVFCLATVVQEFAENAAWMLWLTAALGLALFVVYDILLSRFAILYRRRRRR